MGVDQQDGAGGDEVDDAQHQGHEGDRIGAVTRSGCGLQRVGQTRALPVGGAEPIGQNHLLAEQTPAQGVEIGPQDLFLGGVLRYIARWLS